MTRIVTPEEREAQAINDKNLSDRAWGDSLITPVTVAPVKESLMTSDVPGVVDEVYTATIKRLIAGQLDEGWELVREEAELAVGPTPQWGEASMDSLMPMPEKSFVPKSDVRFTGTRQEATERSGVPQSLVFDPDTSSWTVVGPPKGTYPTLPWHVVASRCEHGVMIVNPESAPKSHICQGCRIGLMLGVPRKTPATVDSFTAKKIIHTGRHNPHKDKCDPTQRHTSGKQVQVVGKPWPYLSKFQPSPILQTRATGIIILVPPTPTTIPYNVVTYFGKLEHVGRYSNATVGRELAKALGRGSQTSLDKDFTTDGHSAEMNSDGDDFGVFEPTVSLTMNSEPETQIEVTVPHKHITIDGTRYPTPAHSFIENILPIHSPADLQMLPADFEDKALGIKGRTSDGTPRGRIDVFVLAAMLKAIEDFNREDTGPNGEARDVRLAKFISRRFSMKSDDLGLDDYPVPDHQKAEILERGREAVTPKKVRTLRERFATNGIL